MDKKGIILPVAVCLLITIAVAQLSHKGVGFCPMSSTVSQCTPRCQSDFQCPSSEICCPNRCGSRSCVQPSAVNTGYSRESNDAVYCAGVRCGPYEKCVFDRSTKREKCTRT